MIKYLFNSKCTISYYAEGARDDLGQPSRTLTERASGVPCRLELRSKSLRYERPERLRLMERQGTVEVTTHFLYITAGQLILVNDIITDEDGSTYTVGLIARRGNSHKEALLTRV